MHSCAWALSPSGCHAGTDGVHSGVLPASRRGEIQTWGPVATICYLLNTLVHSSLCLQACIEAACKALVYMDSLGS